MDRETKLMIVVVAESVHQRLRGCVPRSSTNSNTDERGLTAWLRDPLNHGSDDHQR